ncbi:zinc finger TRAF-type-containing protein 1-B-like [Drosophila tropicalis]|uniref:zinc finger TRAF-type-containing protein 1-B-like n=1 Tax=Drosophila tropicalis TaxID=46794 RepID=UPI0035AB97E9
MDPGLETSEESEQNENNNESMAVGGDVDLTNVITPDGPIMDSAGNPVRLCELMRCVKCHRVPVNELFQCQNGHLICGSCYQIRVLDKMLGPQLGTCPTCSVRIYRHLPNRNLIAEHALKEVRTVCRFCGNKTERSTFRQHLLNECPNSIVFCKYRRIGCQWNGKKSQMATHESQCSFPHKTGAELREALLRRQASLDADREHYTRFSRFTQLANISVRLLQVLPIIEGMARDETKAAVHFQAYNVHWTMHLRVDTSGNNVDGLCSIMFRLRLDSSVESTFVLSYSMLHGTYCEVTFLPNLCERFGFSNENKLGPVNVIYRHVKEECLKLLNERGLFARLLIARA